MSQGTDADMALRQRNTDVQENGGEVPEKSADDLSADSLSGVDIEMESPVKMKKNVGLISGISLIVGTIIGSGIFISPKGVLRDTGSVGLSLIVWAASGLIALLGALSYSELGTLIRESGGEYAYLRRAFGNVPAYLYSWTSVIVIRPSSVAIISLTCAEYLISIFNFCGKPVIPTKVAAAAIIMTVALLNCYSTKLAARVQVVFTAAKLIALIIIIIGGIVNLAQGKVDVLATGMEGSTSSPSVIALAFYGALWAYDGWNNLNYVTEELVNPRVNLPRANIAAVFLVTAVYILTNVSYLTVMTKEGLLSSPAVALTWSEQMLGVAAIIMPLSVIISTFGAANGTAFAGGRVCYTAGRDGNLPEFLSFVSTVKYTPITSVAFTCILALLMIIPGEIGTLIDFFSFTAWMFYGATFAAFLVLRYRMRDAERPYKCPIVIPIIMLLVSIYLVIAPIVENPQLPFLYAAIFVFGSLIFYVPFVHFKLQLPFMDEFTTGVQLFLEVAPSPYVPED